jgi:hypothetical protein
MTAWWVRCSSVAGRLWGRQGVRPIQFKLVRGECADAESWDAPGSCTDERSSTLLRLSGRSSSARIESTDMLCSLSMNCAAEGEGREREEACRCERRLPNKLTALDLHPSPSLLALHSDCLPLPLHPLHACLRTHSPLTASVSSMISASRESEEVGWSGEVMSGQVVNTLVKTLLVLYTQQGNREALLPPFLPLSHQTASGPP